MKQQLLSKLLFLSVMIITSFIGLPDACSQSGWIRQSSGTTNPLNKVFFTDADNGTAVGRNGTILHTTNGGATWVAQSSGTTNHLSSIYFRNESNGVIVGDSGTILRSSNGGLTWNLISIETTNHLNDVSFMDDSNGVIVGDNGGILRTTNGGSTWTILSNLGSRDLYGVSFSNVHSGVAVGNGRSCYRTTDRGLTWTTVSIPNLSTFSLNDISFRDTNIGIMVVDGGSILRTSNGGTSWTKRTSGTFSHLYSVRFTGGVEFTVVGHSGTILRSTDGGYNWLNQSSGTTERLLGVMFADDSTGWIVGDSGIILHTTNGGGIPTPNLSHLDAPSVINFGDLDAGSMIDTTIDLHNSGNAAYDIGYYTLNDVANGFKLLDTSLHIIYADKIGKIKLRFAPLTEMTYQAILTISRYENGNLYIDTIKLFGKGINSKLSTSQSTLDFGNVDSASSKTLSFNVVNKVTSPIVINSLSITGSNQFSIVSPSTPFNISGGGQSEISVKYSPIINGIAQATLSIVAEDGTTALISLNGFGVGKGDTTSSSTQFEPKKVDRIVIAPNPSSGTSSLYIEASSYYEAVTLSFMDETGREIGTQFIGSLGEGKTSIPLTLPQTSGIIFIRVLSDGENIGSARAILNK